MSPAVLDAAEAAHITHLSHVFFYLDWHTESAVQMWFVEADSDSQITITQGNERVFIGQNRKENIS